MNTINWYPGHMKKTRELIQSNLGMVDLVLEVVDSRIPYSSRSPVIHELIGNKPRLVVLNKSDRSDAEANQRWLNYLTKGEVRAVTANAMTGEGIGKLLSILSNIEAERKKSGTSQKLQRPLRIMIVGVPNVGKSSLINRLTGKKSAKTGDRPGVTKGKQWLTLKNGMQLLDTPGILSPKLEDQSVGLKLAFCGSIKDEIMDIQDLAYEFIVYMQEHYPELLIARYNIEEISENPLDTMEAIAKKRGCILSGGRIDYERAGHLIIDDFRSGRIGKITLEECE